jgi:hypothetical protein
MNDNLFTVQVDINDDAVKKFVRSVVAEKVATQMDYVVRAAASTYISKFVDDRINSVMNHPDILEMLEKLAGAAMATYVTPRRIKTIVAKVNKKYEEQPNA